MSNTYKIKNNRKYQKAWRLYRAKDDTWKKWWKVELVLRSFKVFEPVLIRSTYIDMIDDTWNEYRYRDHGLTYYYERPDYRDLLKPYSRCRCCGSYKRPRLKWSIKDEDLCSNG